MSQNAAEGNAAFVIWSNECLDWDNWSEAFEEDYSNLTEEEKYRLMEELDEQYPQYGFAVHKGYGTRRHYDALNTYGPCPIHRMSFLKKWHGRQSG